MKPLLFLMLLFFFISCRKKFDNTNQVSSVLLPPITDTGANTFGFMLNDTPWTVFGRYKSVQELGTVNWLPNELFIHFPDDTTDKSVGCTGHYTIVKNSVVIKDIQASIQFHPTPPFIKTYFLGNDKSNHFHISNLITGDGYIPDSLNPLSLHINDAFKINGTTSLWVCSGTFNGVLYNYQNKNDSIVITKGRFDIKTYFP